MENLENTLHQCAVCFAHTYDYVLHTTYMYMHPSFAHIQRGLVEVQLHVSHLSTHIREANAVSISCS